MLKYLYCREVFSEVPEEISLALSISNCQIHCKGCNQPELWQDEGEALTENSILNLIDLHKGITCVCFMGSGNREYPELNALAKAVKSKGLKTAVYLGEDEIPEKLDKSLFDFIKIGHWDESKGGLDSPETNQRMISLEHQGDGSYWETVINNKFLKHEN